MATLTIAQQIAQAQAMLNQTKAQGSTSFAGSSYASPSYVPPPTQNTAPVLTQPQLTQTGQQNQQATGTQTYRPPQNTTLSMAPLSSTPAQNQNLGIGTPPTPTMPPPPPTSPVTAPVDTAQTNPYEQQYKDLLKPTDTENQLANQQISLQDSYNKGTVQNEGALAPMSAIAGDQQLIDKSFNLSNQTLTQRLALEQSKRQNAIDVSKFAMGRADKKTAAEAAVAKDQRDYQQQLALAQAKMQPQSPSDIYGTGSVGEYNFAKSQGYKGTFSQYQNEDANRKAVIAKAGSNDGYTGAQINSTVNSIMSAFDNEPVVRQYQTIAQTVDTVKNLGTSPTDDIRRIYAVAKVFDPNSAVREGEYSTVQEYATSLLQRVGLKANRVFNNDGFLTTEAQKFINTTLNNELSVAKKAYDNTYSSYNKRIADAKSGQGGSITDYSAGYTPIQSQQPSNNEWLATPNYNQDIQLAKQAIAGGADPVAVKQRLLTKYKTVNL